MVAEVVGFEIRNNASKFELESWLPTLMVFSKKYSQPSKYNRCVAFFSFLNSNYNILGLSTLHCCSKPWTSMRTSGFIAAISHLILPIKGCNHQHPLHSNLSFPAASSGRFLCSKPIGAFQTNVLPFLPKSLTTLVVFRRQFSSASYIWMPSMALNCERVTVRRPCSFRQVEIEFTITSGFEIFLITPNGIR